MNDSTRKGKKEAGGTLRATDQVLLHASAKVWADVFTPALVVEEGAFLEGKVSMEANEKKKVRSQDRS